MNTEREVLKRKQKKLLNILVLPRWCKFFSLVRSVLRTSLCEGGRGTDSSSPSTVTCRCTGSPDSLQLPSLLSYCLNLFRDSRCCKAARQSLSPLWAMLVRSLLVMCRSQNWLCGPPPPQPYIRARRGVGFLLYRGEVGKSTPSRPSVHCVGQAGPEFSEGWDRACSGIPPFYGDKN